MNQTIEEKNKALVLEAFDTLFNKRDYVAAERYWSPNYIQHSAHIEPGRDGLVNLICQELSTGILPERRTVGFEKTAFSRNGFDDALALQFRVSLGNGVTVHTQFFRQRADGRKRLARLQRAGSGRRLHLVHHLKIDRLAGFEIDLKHHGAVFCPMTLGQSVRRVK